MTETNPFIKQILMTAGPTPVPPQRTACSPNRSVSVSSRKDVSITPPRVQPIPFA